MVDTNGSIDLIATSEYEITPALRQNILDIASGAADSLHAIAALDQQLAELYAEAIHSLLNLHAVNIHDIQAIGSHGQTVRHAPDNNPPYSMQLGNGALIAELTGIRTINDFRQGDIAAGGQGAPLAPLFHHHLFHEPGRTIVGLNLGGIANISILHADGEISGFDTGPANTLMDQWIAQHQQVRYDKDALWARSGSINHDLLDKLLAEAWLIKTPPKSTGPELFNLQWLNRKLKGTNIRPEDVQRTLCEYSALTIGNAVRTYARECSKLVICGGGAYNPLLVERIQYHLGDCTVVLSSDYKIDPEWIECTMFAWFAWRTLNGLPSNVPTVTGARHKAILGAVHPVNTER
jgi:anhydro-N-acetylmuramic acid kinase